MNYDILSYLPDSLETVKGQDVMVDEFGMGAFSMIVVEDMSMKDAAALEKKTRRSIMWRMSSGMTMHWISPCRPR